VHSHILACRYPTYAVRVTVFTIWPDDVRWRRVSPRLFVVHLAGYLATIAVLGAAAATIWYAVGWPQVWTVLVTVNLLIVIRLAFVPRSLRSWGYAERADDLLVRHGLLYRRLSIVPYGRMQFVDVTAGPLERLLGLATVQLHTAAAATDARIPGLTAAEAARLRDRLAALGEARAEGL
jgi:membrane protein YdbS with pleckstrin-like domain